MTGLAPVSNVRGDTFLIRAAGISSPDIGSGSSSVAICEAVVQRIPQTVDLADAIITPTAAFGRKFIIRSIRWIDGP